MKEFHTPLNFVYHAFQNNVETLVSRMYDDLAAAWMLLKV